MYRESLAILLSLSFGVFLNCSSSLKKSTGEESTRLPQGAPGQEVRKKHSSAGSMKPITGLLIPDNLPEIVRQTNRISGTLATRARSSGANPILRAAIDHPAFCDASAEMVDFRAIGLVSPVKDQNVDYANQPVECGSCWAFATNAVLESSYLATRKEHISASEQELISCSSAGSCDGGWWAFDFVWKPGIESEVNYRYEGKDSPCRTPIATEFRSIQTGYVSRDTQNARSLVPTDAELKAAMCQHGPLAVAFDATPAFITFGNDHHDVDSIFSERDSGPVNHGISLVGWDKNGWIIKNSWGTDWGQKGFLAVKYGTNSIGLGAAWVEAWPKNYDPSPPIRKVLAATPVATKAQSK